MRRRHLLKLHLPRVPLSHPQRAEMLIPRRWSLVLRWTHAQHNVVGHNRHTVARRHYLHIVRLQVVAAIAKLIDHVLPAVHLPVVQDEREVIGQRALDKCYDPLSRRLHKTFLRVHQCLLQRGQRLGRRSSLSIGRRGNDRTKQSNEESQTAVHAGSFLNLGFGVITPSESSAPTLRAAPKPAPPSPDFSAQTSPTSLH